MGMSLVVLMLTFQLWSLDETIYGYFLFAINTVIEFSRDNLRMKPLVCELDTDKALQGKLCVIAYSKQHQIFILP